MRERESAATVWKPERKASEGGRRTNHSHPLLHLQHQRGNRFVQQLMAWRQHEGELEPETEQGIQQNRGAGRPLDGLIRERMESILGVGLHGVRIHTGAQADKLSQEISARAFTTGPDIFFRNGEYRPGTSAGRELLAHELTHVAQQEGAPIQGKLTVGLPDDRYEKEADQVGRLVTQQETSAIDTPTLGGAPLLQRQLAAAEEAKKETDEEKKQRLSALGTEIVNAVKGAIAVGLDFKQLWSTIEGQIKKPVAKAPRKTKFPTLYAEALAKKMTALTDEEESTVVADVFSQLVTTLTTKSGDDVKQEFNGLSKRFRDNIQGGLAGYVAMRPWLIAAFGTLDNANEYFSSLVQADFPSANSKARGRYTLVHPKLKERLDQASTALRTRKTGDQTWADLVESGIQEIGGFNIRENTTTKNELSDHSFGRAIDIDPDFNPAIKASDFPRTLVTGLTSEDVVGGGAISKFRAGGSVSDLLPSAQTLRTSSDTFKGAFASETTLSDALVKYLKDKYQVTLTSDQATDLMGHLKSGSKAEANVTAWLMSLPAATATTETTPAASTSAEPVPTGAPGKATKPVANQATAAPAGAFSKANASAAATFLTEAYTVFKGTTTKEGKQIPAASEGTKFTVAAHGFISFPPQLIATLTGSDGGNLEWLGKVSEGSRKDYMHFQLKKADWPPLVKAEAKSAETEKEGPGSQ